MASVIATAFVAVRPNVAINEWVNELKTEIPKAVKGVPKADRSITLFPKLDTTQLKAQIAALEKGFDVPFRLVQEGEAVARDAKGRATKVAKETSDAVAKVSAATRKKVETPLKVTVDRTGFGSDVLALENRLKTFTGKTHHVKLQIDLLGLSAAETAIAKLTGDIAALEAALAKATGGAAKVGPKARGGAKPTEPAAIDVTPKLKDGGKSLISEIKNLQAETWVKAHVTEASIGGIQTRLNEASFTIKVDAILTPEAQAALAQAEKVEKAAEAANKPQPKGRKTTTAAAPAVPVTPTVAAKEAQTSLTEQMKGIAAIPFAAVPVMDLTAARTALQKQATELGAIEVNIVGKVAAVEETAGGKKQVDVPISTNVSQEELNLLATRIKEGTAAEIEVVAKLAPNTRLTLQEQLDAITGLGVKVTGQLTGTETVAGAASGAAGAAGRSAGGGAGGSRAISSAQRLEKIQAQVASVSEAAEKKIRNLAQAQDFLTKASGVATEAQKAFQTEQTKGTKDSEKAMKGLRDQAAGFKELAKLRIDVLSSTAPQIKQQKDHAAATDQLSKAQAHLNEVSERGVAAALSGNEELANQATKSVVQAQKAFDKAQQIERKLAPAAAPGVPAESAAPAVALTATQKAANEAKAAIAELNPEIEKALKQANTLAGAEGRLAHITDTLTAARSRLQKEIRAVRTDNAAVLKGQVEQLEGSQRLATALRDLNALRAAQSQRTPGQIQTGLGAGPAKAQADAARAELKQAREISETVAKGGSGAFQSQAAAAVRSSEAFHKLAASEELAANAAKQANASAKALDPQMRRLTIASNDYVKANVAAQEALQKRVGLEDALKKVQQQRTKVQQIQQTIEGKEASAARTRGLAISQRLIGRISGFEQVLEANLKANQVERGLADIPAAAGKARGVEATVRRLAAAEVVLEKANLAAQAATELDLGDKTLIEHTANLQKAAVAAKALAVSEKARAETFASVNPILERQARVQQAIARVEEAGGADVGVKRARTQLVAAINAERLATSLKEVEVANADLLPHQREAINTTLDQAIATRTLKEDLLEQARAAEKVALTQSQFKRGIFATSASFLGLRGAVLASSAGFLAATIGLTLFSKIISSSGELQQGLNTFQAVVGATGEQMKEVSSLAQQLGADITLPATSANDAVNAMTELAKAGLSVANSMAAARGTLQLAAAASIDAGDAAQATASILNQYALAGEEAAKVTDLLANASILAQGSIVDFVNGFRALGPTAHEAGLTVQQTTALLTELGRAGLAGAFGGTAIKTFLLRLIPASKEAADAQKLLGIHLDETRSIGEQLPQIIAQYAAGLQKLQPLQRTATLDTIFGTRGIQAAGVIFGQGSANFLQFQADVSKSGTGAELANARMKGLKGSVDALGSSTQTLATELGEFFLPALTTITREVTKMVNALGSAAQAFAPLKGFISFFTSGPLGGFLAQVGLIAAAGAGLVKLQARFHTFFGSAAKGSTEAAVTIVEDQAAVSRAVFSVQGAVEAQARAFIGPLPKAAEEGAALVIASERAKLIAINEVTVALAREAAAAKTAGAASLIPGFFKRKGPVGPDGQPTAAKPFKGFSGAGFGVGIGASIAGELIGGQAGGALSAAGQGAALGAFFGPEGAAAGAAVFGALNLFTEAQNRSKDRLAKAKAEFSKLSFDEQLQYLLDRNPDLKKPIERLLTTEDSGALASFLKQPFGRIKVEEEIKRLGGLNFGITQADLSAARGTLVQAASGFAPRIAPRQFLPPQRRGTVVIGHPQTPIDRPGSGDASFPFLINPLATKQAVRGFEAAAAVAAGTRLKAAKATTAFEDFKNFLGSFGITLGKVAVANKKVKLQSLLTADTQRDLNDSLRDLANGTDASASSFEKQEAADKRLVTRLRSQLTAPNATLDGWKFNLKQREKIAKDIIKIAERIADYNDKIIAAIQKSFAIPTAQATLAQTRAAGTKSLQDNLAADEAALKVQEDILAQFKAHGRKQADILAQQNEVESARNAVTADQQAIRDKEQDDADKRAEAAKEALSAREAGLRFAADAAGNVGKAEAALLAFLQAQVKAAKKNTTAYWDAVNALKAERDKQKDAIQSIADSAKELINLQQEVVDLQQQNRLAAAGLTPSTADNKAALNAILATQNKRLISAQKVADDLKKAGKVGSKKWLEAKLAIENLRGQIIGTRQAIKDLSGGSGGFTLRDLFKEALSQFAAFGSNVTTQPFDLGDVRGQFAGKLIATITGSPVDRAALGLESLAGQTLTENQKQTAYLAELVNQGIPLYRGSSPQALGRATGGITPGKGRGDTVPAMLTPGEVVFNNKQIGVIAKRLGIPNTPHAVFAAGQKFADGGVVGAQRFAEGGAVAAQNYSKMKGIRVTQDPKTGCIYVGDNTGTVYRKFDPGDSGFDKMQSYVLAHPGGQGFVSDIKSFAKSFTPSGLVAQGKGLYESVRHPIRRATSGGLLSYPGGKPGAAALRRQQALSDYIGWGSTDMNDLLRKGIPPPKKAAPYEMEMYGAMKEMYGGLAMSMKKLAKPKTVYRGVPWDAFGYGITEKELKALEGTIYRDPAFLSTSVHRATAGDFMGTAAGADSAERGALLSIHLPKGQKVAPIPGWDKGFEEFVLPPNSALKINKVSIKPGGLVDSLTAPDFKSQVERLAYIDATAIPGYAEGGVIAAKNYSKMKGLHFYQDPKSGVISVVNDAGVRFRTFAPGQDGFSEVQKQVLLHPEGGSLLGDVKALAKSFTPHGLAEQAKGIYGSFRHPIRRIESGGELAYPGGKPGRAGRPPGGPLPAQDLFSEVGRVEAKKMLDKLTAASPGGRTGKGLGKLTKPRPLANTRLKPKTLIPEDTEGFFSKINGELEELMGGATSKEIQDAKEWVAEEYAKKYGPLRGQITKLLGKSFKDAILVPPFRKSRNFSGTLDDFLDGNALGQFDLRFGNEDFAPGMTIFEGVGGKLNIDDVLDINDPDFFKTAAQSAQYANALKLLRGEKQSGFVTLHRGMSAKERDAWAKGETIPAGKFFTNQRTSQFASDIAGEFPELFTFKVAAQDVVETSPGTFQLINPSKLQGKTISSEEPQKFGLGGIVQDLQEYAASKYQGAKGAAADIKNFATGGGSDQPVLPFQGGKPQGQLTEKQTLALMREMVTSITGADALAEFQKRPDLIHGISAAVSLPLFFGSGYSAGKGGRNVVGDLLKLEAMANIPASALRQKDFEIGASIDEIYAMVNKAPLFTSETKVAKGKLYRVELPEKIKRTRLGGYVKEHRLPLIQDPTTGAMFASARPDVHHGDLMRHMIRLGFIPKVQHEEGLRAASFRVNKENYEYKDWLQHIVGAKYDVGSGERKDTIPGVFLGDPRVTAAEGDTRAATFGRMRLFRDLHDAGFDLGAFNPGRRRVGATAASAKAAAKEVAARKAARGIQGARPLRPNDELLAELFSPGGRRRFAEGGVVAAENYAKMKNVSFVQDPKSGEISVINKAGVRFRTFKPEQPGFKEMQKQVLAHPQGRSLVGDVKAVAQSFTPHGLAEQAKGIYNSFRHPLGRLESGGNLSYPAGKPTAAVAGSVAKLSAAREALQKIMKSPDIMSLVDEKAFLSAQEQLGIAAGKAGQKSLAGQFRYGGLYDEYGTLLESVFPETHIGSARISKVTTPSLVQAQSLLWRKEIDKAFEVLNSVLGIPIGTRLPHQVRVNEGVADPFKGGTGDKTIGLMHPEGDFLKGIGAKAIDVLNPQSTVGRRSQMDTYQIVSTLIHEVGHVLDATLLKKTPKGVLYGSNSAVGNTRANSRFTQLMNEIVVSPEVGRIGRKVYGDRWREIVKSPIPLFAEQAPYHLKPIELFARAFTQWTAERTALLPKTGNKTPGVLKPRAPDVLRAEVELGVGGKNLNYWPSDEFVPIAAAMDKLLASKGMLRDIPKFGIGGIVKAFAGGGVKGMGTDTVPAMLTPGEVVLNDKQIKTIASKLGVSNSPHAVFAAGQGFDLGGVVGSVKDKLGDASHWLGVKTNFKGMGEKEAEAYARSHPMLWAGKGGFKAFVGQLLDPAYQLAKHPGIGTGVGTASVLPLGGRMAAPRASLQKVVADAKPNVTMGVSEFPDALLLHQIESHRTGEGHASRALDALGKYADTAGKSIFLTPEQVGGSGLSTRNLAAWYARHGYRWNGQKMERQPALPGYAVGGVIGDVLGGAKKVASGAFNVIRKDIHSHDGNVAYEYWRRDHWKEPQFKMLRDAALFSTWKAYFADKKFRDIRYEGSDAAFGGSHLPFAGGGVVPGFAAGGVASAAMAQKMFLAPVPHPGLLQRGNIDLDQRKRPLVHNKDGTDSSVLSTSYRLTREELADLGIKIPTKNAEVLIPQTIRNAKGKWINASGAEALQHFRETGKHLGIFKNAKTADVYGSALHNYLAKFTESIHRATGGVTPRFMAEGGIVNKPTLAMIGERGSEAVVPLSRSRSSLFPVSELVPLQRTVANNTGETNDLLRQLINLLEAPKTVIADDILNRRPGLVTSTNARRFATVRNAR